MGKRQATRSPLKDVPLRLPGQSVQEQIDRIYETRVLQPIVLTAGFIILAIIQWSYTLIPARPNPLITTGVAMLALAYTVVSVTRAKRTIHALGLARDGERIVAEQIDQLKQQGAAVIHDVVGDGFNIDHVILSTKGVFVAETKTRSKPKRGSPTVSYDGKTLKVAGFTPDRDPVSQARANARWIAKSLSESTGKSFPTKAVVLFPGWFVEPIPPNHDIWILEPKALPTFIANELTKISEEDLHLAVFHLSRMVRPRKDAA
jgi:hypothetical protein